MIVSHGAWRVGFAEDADGHLTVWLEHADGSAILETGHGWEPPNDFEWQGRFTTKQIENDYLLRDGDPAMSHREEVAS